MSVAVHQHRRGGVELEAAGVSERARPLYDGTRARLVEFVPGREMNSASEAALFAPD